MNTKSDRISTLIQRHKKVHNIQRYNIHPTKTEHVFLCSIYFFFKKLVGQQELEVSFLWNLSTEKLLDIKEYKDYTVYSEEITFSKFLYQLISSRARGENNENRGLKIAKSISDISPELRVSKVAHGSEYADNKFKADVQVFVVYSYKGMFDKTNGTHTFIINVQIKSSKVFQKKHQKMHVFTPSIVITKEMSDAQVKETFIRVLRGACKFKIKQLYASLLRDIDNESAPQIEYTRKGVYHCSREMHL